MLIALTLLAGAILQAAPAPAPSPSPCPATSRVAGETALTPFTPGRFQWFRERYGLTGISQKAITVLGHGRVAGETRICERFNTGFRDGFATEPTIQRTYFQAGNYYLAVLIDGRDRAQYRLRYPIVMVFDDSLKYVASIMPQVNFARRDQSHTARSGS